VVKYKDKVSWLELANNLHLQLFVPFSPGKLDSLRLLIHNDPFYVAYGKGHGVSLSPNSTGNEALSKLNRGSASRMIASLLRLDEERDFLKKPQEVDD
jgi:hypothetical protein